MKEQNINQMIKFYSPFADQGVLIKSDKKDPSIVYIEASNQLVDSQNDVTVMKALKEETENFLRKGVISWDHLHKSEKSPEYIIGEPLDVAFKKETTWVKAKLYKSVKYGQSVLDLLESETTRLGASIGGYIKQRQPLSKSISAITKVIWDEIAITYKPVNDTTLGNVSLIPIGAFQKALMAGSGVNTANFTGGRAMTPESLQGANAVNIKKITEDFAWRLNGGDIRTSDDLMDFLELHGVPNYYDLFARKIVQIHGRN
jgi:hypothetical protein